MDLYAVLDQVVDLVRQRKRITYRLLQRQFALDEATLEDLKAELFFAHPQIADADGHGLIWTEEADVTSEPAPTPAHAAPPVPQHPQQVASPMPPQTAEAERRQLTVMFCDLVESTTLSSQLDPEEYRDVVRAYHTACTEVIRRYDGHIAQLLGDGLLVYFGYPQAHEDDAQRAVHTGLGILEGVEALNTRLEQAKGITLAVRLGIHTGLVVVGDMGGAGRQEQLALGEVPNIASRIEGLAAPNTIAMSEATYRLVQGYFACQGLGVQTLRGVPQPLHVYRVLGASGVHSRLEVAQTRGLTPLVGREQEVGLLLERWEQVKAGHGQVVLLTGDAGIGKSRLVQMLKDHVANEPHVRWECRSVEYSQNTALFPLVDLFQRILQFETGDTPDEKLAKLKQMLSQYRLPLGESIPLFAPLLSLSLPENRYPPLNLSPQRQRQKTLETIVAILLELAERQPVLFILEDLHWTDPTTLEWLNLLIDQTPMASMLVLLTCRPHFQPAWHHRSYLTEMTLNRLSHTQVEQIVAGITDDTPFPAEVLQQIIAKTDGVPLFVEEMTKAILESGHLKEVDSHYELLGSLLTLAIPATLQDSLMARLDRLVTAKAVAQYAAVIGRQFSYELLQAVSQVDEAMLQHELRRLVEAEIVYQRGVLPQAIYVFKHALIQDAAYESLLKSTRQPYHQRIAHVLEEQFPETTQTQPELLAHHYTEAGLIERAVGYWHQAGQSAVQRSAHVEAIAHFTTGLQLLETLPDTPERARQELALRAGLGVPLSALKGPGAPEVFDNYGRARQLCHDIPEAPEHYQVLWGAWRSHLAIAKLEAAQELADQLVALAQREQETGLLLEAHHAQWTTLSRVYEPQRCWHHAKQGMALYQPERHHHHVFTISDHDAGVCCRGFGALSLWQLGHLDQALTHSCDAIALARRLAHSTSLAHALTHATWLLQLRRDLGPGLERAEEIVAIASEYGFAQYLATAAILKGWLLTRMGQGNAGLALMRQGLDSGQAKGTGPSHAYFLYLLAEAHLHVGEARLGRARLAEALDEINRVGTRAFEPEMHRVHGELLCVLPDRDEAGAEACFHTAIAMAQAQHARTLELRAATSLARLSQRQGKGVEACTLLAESYSWFTEGFDTADLQEAKVLLDELGA